MKYINKYRTFIKYIFSSGSSSIVDLGLFTVFFELIKKDTYASILARIISSLYNYIINRKIVFNSNENKFKSFVSYYLLVIIQMFFSTFLVHILFKIINVYPTVIKIFVDLIIFFINYFVQKFYIFKASTNTSST